MYGLEILKKNLNLHNIEFEKYCAGFLTVASSRIPGMRREIKRMADSWCLHGPSETVVDLTEEGLLLQPGSPHLPTSQGFPSQLGLHWTSVSQALLTQSISAAYESLYGLVGTVGWRRGWGETRFPCILIGIFLKHFPFPSCGWT